MKITAILTALLATASGGAYAQSVDSTYVSSIVTALKAANLTAFAGVAQAIAYTRVNGPTVLANLPGSSKTVFAPTDEAFAALPKSVSSNISMLADVISYHILNGSISPEQIASQPSHRVFVSLYENGLLPGNQYQPVVFDLVNDTQSNTRRFIFPGQNSNATVYADIEPVPGSPANFMIYPIHAFLSLPQSLSELATSYFPAMASVISDAGLLEPLAQAEGVTIFAPNDPAMLAAGTIFGSLNSTQVQTVLTNHVINGSVVYSTDLEETTYTSAGGIPFKFLTNTTGTFVMSGNNTARIIAPDIPMANGVVHIIDRVLANPIGNTEAAQSAASSYAVQATASPMATAAKGSATQSIPFSIVGAVGATIAAFASVLAGGAHI